MKSLSAAVGISKLLTPPTADAHLYTTCAKRFSAAPKSVKTLFDSIRSILFIDHHCYSIIMLKRSKFLIFDRCNYKICRLSCCIITATINSLSITTYCTIRSAKIVYRFVYCYAHSGCNYIILRYSKRCAWLSYYHDVRRFYMLSVN